jgi:hypothetical protein
MCDGSHSKPELIRGISFKTLGLVVGSAMAGAAGSLLLVRVSAGGVESFSVVGLLVFFAVAFLAGAAIALSITAISISRRAERMILERSEQVAAPAPAADSTESFERTVRQLGRDMKASMDAELNLLKQELREERVIAPANEAPLPPEEPGQVEVDKAEKKYSDFKDIVLVGVANYPGVESHKVGEGHYRTEGDELVDGAFVLNRERVAVCAFATGELLIDRFLGQSGDSFSGFLDSLRNELKKGNFSRIFLVFDGMLNNSCPYAKALNRFSSRVPAEVFSRFELFEGSPEIVIPELTERVSQLMALDEENSAASDAG